MEFYTVKLLALERQLPLIHVSRKLKLATFNFLGDVELVDKLADAIAEKLSKITFDYLIAPHVKVTPLVHGVAKRLEHKRFVVCRKNIKSYMTSPVVIKPDRNYPKHVKALVLNGTDARLLQGRKVVIIDDVVSTGMTMKLTQTLVTKINAKLALSIAIFKQGDLSREDLPNLWFLEKLPTFPVDV